MAMDDIEALKEIPLFSEMDHEEVSTVFSLMDRHTFTPGQVIMREGEPGDYFYVIVHGKVQFLVQDAGGRELVIDEVGPSGFFGELSIADRRTTLGSGKGNR